MAKKDALSDINNAIKENSGSAYLNSIVASYIEAIKSATDKNTVNKKKTEAIQKLNAALQTYNTIKAEVEVELWA